MTKRKKYPYEGSHLSPAQSREGISELLAKHGCRDLQWLMRDNKYSLKFALPIKFEGGERLLAFMFVPPLIPKKVKEYNKEKYRYEDIWVNDDVVAFRVLFWYLKNKIIAVETGLISAEQEFMANIIVPLPDGRGGMREGTLVEKLRNELPRLSEAQDFTALPAPTGRKNDDKTIDTTGTVS